MGADRSASPTSSKKPLHAKPPLPPALRLGDWSVAQPRRGFGLEPGLDAELEHVHVVAETVSEQRRCRRPGQPPVLHEDVLVLREKAEWLTEQPKAGWLHGHADPHRAAPKPLAVTGHRAAEIDGEILVDQ